MPSFLTPKNSTAVKVRKFQNILSKESQPPIWKIFHIAVKLFYLAEGFSVLHYGTMYAIYVIMCDEGEKYLHA